MNLGGGGLRRSLATRCTPRPFGSAEDHGGCPAVCKLNLGLESQMARSCATKRHASDGRGTLGKNERCVSDEASAEATVFIIYNTFKRLGSAMLYFTIHSQ